MSNVEDMSEEELDKKLAPVKSIDRNVRGLLSALGPLEDQLINIMNTSASAAEVPAASGKGNQMVNDDVQRRIDKIKRAYAAYTAKLERNINYLQSLMNYNSQASALIDHYKQQISEGDEEVAAQSSKINIANRLSTFYNNREKKTDPWIYYLRIVYWGVFCALLLVFLRDFYKGGYLRRLTHSAELAKDTIVARVAKETKKMTKVSPALTVAQQKQIKVGPQQAHKASLATKPVLKGGGQTAAIGTVHTQKSNKYNVIPGSILLLLFILLPFFIIPLLNLIRKMFFPRCCY